MYIPNNILFTKVCLNLFQILCFNPKYNQIKLLRNEALKFTENDILMIDGIYEILFELSKPFIIGYSTCPCTFYENYRSYGNLHEVHLL